MVYAVKVVEKLLKSEIVRFVCSHGASGGFAAAYGLVGWRLKRTGMTVAIPLMATVISRRNRLLLSAQTGSQADAEPKGFATAFRPQQDQRVSCRKT
jgi:hypothetical protein